MSLAPGARLGRYEIRSLLGAGGMGEVYLAHDPDLERDVAIKILRDGQDADRSRRFIQEAKAASNLHHPNVAHVYEIGSQDNLRFIAMEVIDGETLRDRIGRDPMPIAEAVDVATQIASALAAAHKQNIIHRDVKPENVIVTRDGYAKVLDFGLAKLREMRADDAATLLKTAPGTAMGTLPYMSPETITGDEATAAADVYSLGVVMYEMLAGRRPFGGANSSEVAGAILSSAPTALHEVRRDVPPMLEAIIAKCMAKSPTARYATAVDVADALRTLSAPVPVPPKRNFAPIVVVVLLIAIVAGAVTISRRNSRKRVAEEKLATAERLVKEHRLADAYVLVADTATVLPASDDRVRDLMTRTSERVTIESDPPGATVFAQRFNGPPDRVRIGVTPTSARMARTDYVLTLEKPGFTPSMAALSVSPLYLQDDAVLREVPPVRIRLVESSKAPADMVLVRGGDYRLASFNRPSERPVTLREFFLDRHEVSNREFARFVSDGGYRRRALWKHPFIDQGKPVPFEAGMARFRDTTGLPGPRGWNGGAPPQGRENHPVTDITWYEAAAFAEWKGKTLPTIYQWERASRYRAAPGGHSSYPWGVPSEGVDVTERSNFLGEGTMPVDSMPFGMSPFGAYHLAGNVSEWCRNVYPPGYAVRGGSFKDAAYAFGQTAALPGFYSSPDLGFRCAIGGAGDEGAFALSPSLSVPKHQPVDARAFEELRRRYVYADDPLDPKVIETIDTPAWTREKILFTVGGKRVSAYLYLPKGFARPLQTIHFAPAGDVVSGLRSLPKSIEAQWASLVRAGRALFAVELEGFLGRPYPKGFTVPYGSQDEFVDYTSARVTEMRRGLDYLQTRPDIDRGRIALFGSSAGGGTGIFVAALETRYRSIVFSGTGLAHRQNLFATAANRVNFVPRITAPTLMIHGRYDEDTSLKIEAEPMFALLQGPKQLEVFEGGHIAPLGTSVPRITKWLDKTMGAVKP